MTPDIVRALADEPESMAAERLRTLGVGAPELGLIASELEAAGPH